MLNPEEINNIRIDYGFSSKVLMVFDNDIIVEKKVKEEDSMYSYIFSLEKGNFEIFLSKKMDLISLEGDWERTKTFVMLFINLLPENHKVHFFDEGYSDNIIITSQTKLSEIKSVFGE